MMTIARNAPCPCGSGKKYKKCCLGKEPREHPPTNPIEQASFGGSPGEPSVAWMQEGYDLAMSGYGARACERWWQVWEIIRSRLRPEMRTCQSASVVFDGPQPIHDWVQDFALELYNAALDDDRHAETGVRLCEEVLSQFPDESELFQLNFRADLGQFHYLAANREEGERVLLELIEDHPDRAAGYARLADILGYGVRRDDGPTDHERAIALFESALARPVTDARHYDLENRLKDLRNSAADSHRK